MPRPKAARVRSKTSSNVGHEPTKSLQLFALYGRVPGEQEFVWLSSVEAISVDEAARELKLRVKPDTRNSCCRQAPKFRSLYEPDAWCALLVRNPFREPVADYDELILGPNPRHVTKGRKPFDEIKSSYLGDLDPSGPAGNTSPQPDKPAIVVGAKQPFVQ